jgi:hypothetical protein
LLRRALGSNEPYAHQPTDQLAKITDLPKAMPASTSPRPSREKPKRELIKRRPADRSRLNAAEAALGELDDERKREEADLRRRQEALDAKRTAAQQSYVEARKKATAAVVAARDAYRKAGGTD